VSGATVTAEVVNEIADGIFHTQSILPTTLLVLTSRVLALITKTIL
jgi:hypothetical protein